MNIVLLEPLGVSEEKITNLSDQLKNGGHTFTYYSSVETDGEKLKQRVKDAEILIIANNPLPADIIKSAKNLKYISVAFTGVDHVDKKACDEMVIKVSNSSGYATESVAELTLGLILSSLRNIVQCDDVVRKEGTKAGLIGNELNGKTIGIVGTGAIGLRVAEILKVFGCRIHGYSRTVKEAGLKLGIEYVSLEELLKGSDIVSLHTPLTDETTGLINKERLEMMKKNSILINVARGKVVDSNALAEALNNDKIAGACIDVFEMEPPIPQNHALLNAKNVLATPHIAFATKESMIKRAETAFDNVYSWLSGEPKNIM
ncbi:MAG: hydroxyacid dehydrogenase [Firmicutes bacterium HGW-Firmicutes-12]|jgi:D-3-phosphoglycerate dehydrogenase|nr:MAG: hydroxyacid dehydrogenase [Firmicutes bacterium HGW-Firmicutes-12]